MAHATKLVTNIRVKCRESSSFYDQIFRCFFPLRCQVTLRKKLRNLCGVLNLLNVRIFAPLDVAHVRKSTNECRCAKPLYCRGNCGGGARHDSTDLGSRYHHHPDAPIKKWEGGEKTGYMVIMCVCVCVCLCICVCVCVCVCVGGCLCDCMRIIMVGVVLCFLSNRFRRPLASTFEIL